jgi:hypothetical protein
MRKTVYTIDTAIARLQELRQEQGGSAPLMMADGLPVVTLDAGTWYFTDEPCVTVSDHSSGGRLVWEDGDMFVEFPYQGPAECPSTLPCWRCDMIPPREPVEQP